MNATTQRTAWMWCTTLTLAGVAIANPASQPAAGADAPAKGLKVGFVKGDNVYVRSGFNTNYYPVTKLNQGDQVTILGQEYGWVNILPPEGTHSLIEKAYVDRVDDTTGVLNDGRWVYAGSNMDKRRYAKQVRLNKGDKIAILGETPEQDFYKIVPPPGASVWISAEFVERGVDRGGKMASAEAGPNPPVLEPIKPGELKLQEALPDPVAPVPAEPHADEAKIKPGDGVEPPSGDTTLEKFAPPAAPAGGKKSAGLQAGDKYQNQIDAIEAAIAAEDVKPRTERSYAAAIEQLQPLADQSQDEIAQIYATARVRQLRDQTDLIAALGQIGTVRESAIKTSNVIAREREKIRAEEINRRGMDLVVSGEIKVSGIYDGSSTRPRRWRVVDPERDKTLAYIEVPADSSIDPVHYYGKRVGIRSTAWRVLKGTIPPLPIYTVREIVLLDMLKKSDAATPESDAARSASPVPPAVSTPSSQPAASK